MDGTTQPMLPWVGLVSSSMNLKDCYMGCLMIDIVEKETDLTIGISEGICLCGHAFDASSNSKAKLFQLIRPSEQKYNSITQF